MTLYVAEAKHGAVMIAQQAHASHWKLEIDETQVKYLRDRLNDILAERAKLAEEAAKSEVTVS